MEFIIIYLKIVQHRRPFMVLLNVQRKISLMKRRFVIRRKKPIWLSAEESIKVVKSGDNVFVHSIAAAPFILTNAICDHAKKNQLKNIKFIHLGIEGPAKWTDPEYKDMIRSNSLFVSANHRQAINEGRGDFIPVFLSDTQLLFRRQVIKLDVALIQVSLPDKFGFCSFGTSVDCSRAAVQNAKYIIAVANKQMPRTFGDTLIHSSHIDVTVEADLPLPEIKLHQPSVEETKIGNLIAENLIENGATLQMGIGSIPDAALGALTNHKNLGIHTEMFSDGILPLIECGAITNSQKIVHPGKVVATFVLGTKRLYEFINDNPMFVLGDVAWVNDPTVIRQNPKVSAINSCIEIDLTGQVVSDSIGTRIFSGVGGQIDYMRGAALCTDMRGKAIIALTSQTKKGESKIVPFLKEGAGVVTTRAHMHYLVTEYGIADLFGKNLRQRAYELIKIAHPNHRKMLEKAAFDRLKCMPSPD